MMSNADWPLCACFLIREGALPFRNKSALGLGVGRAVRGGGWRMAHYTTYNKIGLDKHPILCYGHNASVLVV